jgi:small subunit ribosomal protein S3
MKYILKYTKNLKIKGIKFQISGKLKDTADRAEIEYSQSGKMSLSKLNLYIDYASIFATTIYGSIGIKVWIIK